MTVKELIEKLKECNHNSEVVYSSYGEGIQMHISDVEVETSMTDISVSYVAIQGD